MNILRKIPVTFLVWVAILALVLAVMTPGLNGEFFYDDNPNIVDNVAIQIDTLNLAALRNSIEIPGAGPLGRPVSVLSFALTHYFFGLDPFAFKAINLAIHILNGLLVGWLVVLLLRKLRGSPLIEQSRTWLPLWVAAIWLIHPINIMPVLLSVQRMTLLSGMFMLLALIAHLKGVPRVPEEGVRWKWLLAGWLVFWPLSVLSKETGLLFPVYVLLITYFSHSGNTLARELPGRVIAAAVVSLFVIGSAMLSYLGSGWLDAAYAMRPFSLAERLLTEARVLWFYAAQTVVPDYAAYGVYHDDIPISTGLTRPLTTLLSLLGWCGVLLAIWRFRHRFPFPCFAAAWFLVGHSLESTFLPLEIAHEYRNYLPSLGLLLGAGFLGAAVMQKLRLDLPRVTTVLVAVIPLAVLALFTWMRADQLGKPLVGTQIEAARHPQSARANYAAAQTMIQSGYGDIGDPIGGHSISYYLHQAGKVDPAFKSAHLALIMWGCASGRPVDKLWIDELAHRLESTPMSPADRDIPSNLLKPLLSMPKCLGRQDAVRLFMAGADNANTGNRLQAGFLEAASDYELLVSHDPVSAKNLMAKAAAASPWDAGMKGKLSEYEKVLSASGHRE